MEVQPLLLLQLILQFWGLLLVLSWLVWLEDLLLLEAGVAHPEAQLEALADCLATGVADTVTVERER